MNTELNLRDRANSFEVAAVESMIEKVTASCDRRDNAVNNGGLSWFNSRKLIDNNKVSFARFMLALDLDPANVIENRIVSSALFNAKALKKVVELARFTVTNDKRIEKVLSAFIICGLRWTALNGEGAIANRFNKSFLSGLSFDDIVEDPELAEYIADYQHKFMSGGKDTQSSQARRVLEVLGLADIETCDNRSRGGVAFHTDHQFFDLFTDAFVK